MKVVRAANWTSASYDGHTLGGAGAEKFDFIAHSTPKIEKFV